MNPLIVPYLANIAILAPVCFAMFAGSGVAGVFDGKVDPSDGLRLLVAALWTAILICSVAGLFAPRFFLPLLAVQVIYKAIWLAVFIAPVVMRDGWDAAPQAISIVFIGIVVLWPLFIWFALRG